MSQKSELQITPKGAEVGLEPGLNLGVFLFSRDPSKMAVLLVGSFESPKNGRPPKRQTQQDPMLYKVQKVGANEFHFLHLR